MNDGLKKGNFLNYSILIPYLLLAGIGVVMVFSATVPYQLSFGLSPYKLAITQVAFVLLSFVAIAVIYRMKLKALKNRRIIGFMIIILLLLLTYSRFGPHTSANGAHGWIPIPGIGTIQPAEFAKVFSVWYLASVFSAKQEAIEQNGINEIFTGKKWYQKLFMGWRLPIVIILGLEFIMPDFGNLVIIAAIVLTMVGVSGISYRWFSGYAKIFVGVIAVFFAAVFATGGNIVPSFMGSLVYQNSRFKAFVNPFLGLDTYGHQMANSYYAIVNGGWFGRGLGNSIEKNGYLPEAHTDFIFSIVVEELGLIGAFIILGIFFFLIIRILLVGIRAKNPFNSLICIGMSVMFLVQIFVNVGGATGIIPETGVTFPFISQGGSSFLVLSLGIAFVLNVSADEKRRELLNLTQEYTSPLTFVKPDEVEA